MKRRSLGLVAAVGALSVVLASCRKKPELPLAVQNVSIEPVRFNPSAGEKAKIRFRTTADARVGVSVMNESGAVVWRKESRRREGAGPQSVSWDGIDTAGRPVSSGVYRFMIEATSSKGVEVRFESSDGGDRLEAGTPSVDRKTGRVSYVLDRPARIRLVLGLFGDEPQEFIPMTVLLDWAPRPAGPNSEPWDGFDQSKVVHFIENARVGVAASAFSLPRTSIIVEGPNGEIAEGPGLLHAEDLHARHPRRKCLDPPLLLTFPEAPTGSDGIPIFRGKGVVRVEVEPRALPRLMGRRSAIFLFVDGIKEFRDLNSYSPASIWLKTRGVNPGKHLITIFMSWPEDHFGIASAWIRVEGNERRSATPKADGKGLAASTSSEKGAK